MTIKEIKRIELPMEVAIAMSADQNWKRDIRLGLASNKDKKEEFPIYEQEARHILETTGENYLPEYPDTKHYVLKKG